MGADGRAMSPRRISLRRAWIAPPLATLAVLGFILASQPATSAASPPCDLYAATNGSDANAGSAASPFATVGKLASALQPGQTGCLAAGATFVGDVSLRSGGSSGAPITLTSSDPADPATIRGRIATLPNADWITFTNLNLDGVNASNLPSPTVGSSHVVFDDVDVTNDHTAICFNMTDSSQWGVARYTTIENSRIHDCGQLPATNTEHGIYDSGFNTTITNNYIYDNADRGVQLRGAQGAVVQHNVIYGNGEGVIFGDLTASNDNVSYNIVSNSVIRSNAESWWGSTPVGTGNTFDDNCVFATNANSYYDTNGGVTTSGGGFDAQDNVVADPEYVDAASGDFTLRAGSGCAGYGPTGVQAPPATSTAATTTTTTTTPPPPPATTATTTTATSPTTTTTTRTTTTTTTTPTTATTPPGTTTTTTTTTTPAPAAPVNVTVPAITGATRTGSVLTASTGTWSPGGSLTFSWLRCRPSGGSCVTVPGATGASYRLGSADVGSRMRVAVVAQNQVSSTAVTSAATGVVKK
jgi:parallel beta-helix repeat protein